MATKSFKGKNILITSGPTWVPIDKVRIISNTATGETGALLAQRLKNAGARVKLIQGPLEVSELSRQIKKELKRGRYHAVIHSAAVADYKIKNASREKISSGKKRLKLDLVPTEKIIDAIKRISPKTLLVGFKFEPDARKARLIKEAGNLMRRSHCDMVVANTCLKNRYYAVIVDKFKTSGPCLTKSFLVDKLINRL